MFTKDGTAPSGHRITAFNLYQVCTLICPCKYYCTPETNTSDTSWTNMQGFCGPDGVKAITSEKMYVDTLAKVVHHYKDGLTNQFKRNRHALDMLAKFHGYINPNFDCKSDQACIILGIEANANHMAALNSKTRKTVDQEGKAFTKTELQEFLKHVLLLNDSSDTLCLLMYAGLAVQDLARSGQVCAITRSQVKLYPDESMHEDADFGPVTLIGLSDRGHLKQNKKAEVTHWLHRHRRPCIADPVFAMAMKAAADNQLSFRGKSGDFLLNVKEGRQGTAFGHSVYYLRRCMQMLNNMLPCSLHH